MKISVIRERIGNFFKAFAGGPDVRGAIKNIEDQNRIICGFDSYTRDAVTINPREMSGLLILGDLGAGKTHTMKSVILSAIASSPQSTMCFVLDKGGWNEAGLREVIGFKNNVEYLTENSEIIALIEDCYEELVRRLDTSKRGQDSFPQIHLCVDGLEEILSILNWDQAQNSWQSPALKFKSIIRTGRSLGINVIATAKTPCNIPSSLRVGFNSTVSLNALSETEAASVGLQTQNQNFFSKGFANYEDGTLETTSVEELLEIAKIRTKNVKEAVLCMG